MVSHNYKQQGTSIYSLFAAELIIFIGTWYLGFHRPNTLSVSEENEFADLIMANNYYDSFFK